MAAPPLTFLEADDALWAEYDAVARRAYGHPVPDILRLGGHADRRVAVRDGRVVAGGLGLLVPQFFGGRPVPAASLACGCVVPEERGHRLAAAMTAQRLRPLREQGAVLASLWTGSTGYVRHLGWEAPTQVYSWTVPAPELARCFGENGFEITHGTTSGVRLLEEELAARWNGTWRRPDWWEDWQHRRHPEVSTYRFARPGGEPTGVLSVAAERHPTEGQQLVVYDFWAADHAVAAAMFAFLGRHQSRIPTIAFQRTGLPPGPLLSHRLHRAGSLTARSWHPWMLRVLDPRRAVQMRGWPEDVDLTVPIEIVTEDSATTEQFLLHVAGGEGELTPTTRAGHITLTRGQFAVWYAGGYRTATAAALAGVTAHPTALTRLLATTAEREPWLADHF